MNMRKTFAQLAVPRFEIKTASGHFTSGKPRSANTLPLPREISRAFVLLALAFAMRRIGISQFRNNYNPKE